ncbi:alpha/beta fold hydrolase [Nocardia sp. NPDC059180]|uniref:alpha/beta fold hydrolase n=1 Tax=Nocardia sp. NPDC059180 TaxID=3346761 RepID=UPI00368F9AD8
MSWGGRGDAFRQRRCATPWDRPFTDAQLAAITAPSLVLFGAETVVNDLEVAVPRARNGIPSAEVHIYPGIGHDLLWANPEQVIPRFLSFTDSHDPVRAHHTR